MKTTLRSQELSCPSCVAKIEKALKGVPGVVDAKVYFNTGKIEVEHDPQQAARINWSRLYSPLGIKPASPQYSR